MDRVDVILERLCARLARVLFRSQFVLCALASPFFCPLQLLLPGKRRGRGR